MGRANSIQIRNPNSANPTHTFKRSPNSLLPHNSTPKTAKPNALLRNAETGYPISAAGRVTRRQVQGLRQARRRKCRAGRRRNRGAGRRRNFCAERWPNEGQSAYTDDANRCRKWIPEMKTQKDAQRSKRKTRLPAEPDRSTAEDGKPTKQAKEAS
ncbi:hypothetical protein PIB30_076677 [Stylosanthes scabra]|uniref:Uncharacterized protein n=1 Tax=Stylosanthes scabra TaxID=79078 RepID=A0ABU6ZNX9_9FABA|nr:hypothetical protein [Stylosanthes scabra]